MSAKPTDIELKLKLLPNKPGVYLYHDQHGKVIYVGKAKDLKKRVSSYFSKNQQGKTAVLVKQIRDIQYIVVSTEIDALLLENNLIKEHQPRYNILLKDDKTYPWICIKNEPFPRVFYTRKKIRDGSKYFGPYASVKVITTLLDLIKELYPLRTCSLNLSEDNIRSEKYKVCLEYHIGNCKGPCVSNETKEQYDSYIRNIEHILRGNLTGVLRSLKSEMKSASENLHFEEAQDIKERIALLERYQAKSSVVSPTIGRVDVLSIVHDQRSAFVNYLMVNNGSIVHGITVEVNKKLDESDSEIIGFVLPELRDRYQSEAREVLVEHLPDVDIPGVQFFVPQKGDKRSLIELSKRNASYYRLEKLKKEKITDPNKHTDRILEQLRVDFRLKDRPNHIECFDNSNFHGTHAVSACVVFRDAKPSKKDYRHFNIKTVEGPDDFASMEEAVYRRYKRMIDEEESLPQLIVIDGGKGQLSAALKALDKLGLRKKIAIVGIAKKLEEIFFPGDSLPIYIDKRSESLKVIQHLRNEAHRFGITHHRNKRSKAALISELTQIKGIGEKTYEELIRHFKSVQGVQRANREELTEVVGPAKAAIILTYFSDR